jgi:hypothetical protein
MRSEQEKKNPRNIIYKLSYSRSKVVGAKCTVAPMLAQEYLSFVILYNVLSLPLFLHILSSSRMISFYKTVPLRAGGGGGEEESHMAG